MKKERNRGIKLPSRLILAGLLILLQIVVTITIVYVLTIQLAPLYILFNIIGLIMITYIINRRGNPDYKLAWIVFIMISPIVCGFMFLIWGNGKMRPKVKKRLNFVQTKTRKSLVYESNVYQELCQKHPTHCSESTILFNESRFPAYTDTSVEYLSPGEVFFPKLLEALQSAEKYIFIEFFILAKGYMWDRIFQILKEKAKHGVEIKIIFDDFGSISRQDRNFIKRLKNCGIKVVAFNPVRPSVDLFLNNRDHRKIVVVDGYIGITGGINIGDEYINRTNPFGYWLDSAVILRGKATANLVVAFCEMWSTINKEYLSPDKYLIDDFIKVNGFVQPYCDDPLQAETPAKDLYCQILSNARKYVYITTPYLILDNTTINYLTLAAKSGIDVRIITPKIRDKWYVHPVTQFNYEELLEAGIRIFEFSKGFIHSKSFVSDDEVATVGTVNMDYRSFYFHFECGTWICGNETVNEIRDHFLKTQSESNEIILAKWKKRPLKKKLKESILHIFAPFM